MWRREQVGAGPVCVEGLGGLDWNSAKWRAHARVCYVTQGLCSQLSPHRRSLCGGTTATVASLV